jgi:hypothetical protein
MRATTAAVLLLVAAVLAAPACARGLLQEEPVDPPAALDDLLVPETPGDLTTPLAASSGTGTCNLPKKP